MCPQDSSFASEPALYLIWTPLVLNVFSNQWLNIRGQLSISGLILMSLLSFLVCLLWSIPPQAYIAFHLPGNSTVMLVDQAGYFTMRSLFCHSLINLVSFFFGQSGVCLWHSDLTLGFSRPWVSPTGHQNSMCRTGDWNPRIKEARGFMFTWIQLISA